MSVTTIDVMMPVFNGEATIVPAIASVLDGDHRDVTLVVVDDGSTDRTGAIVSAWADRDPRIRYIRQENAGIAAARQRAFEATTSEYVSQLDADDLSEPDRLERLLAFMQERPDCVAVCGAARHIDAEGVATGQVVRLPSPKDADPFHIPAREPAQLPFAVWRRSALLAVGGYRPFVYGEDVDLSWRLSEVGTLENIDAIVGSYRFHASNTGSSLLNFRILAVDTQLSALSARRRRRGGLDLDLRGGRKALYDAAFNIESICAVVSSMLTPEEARELRMASAFKLLGWLEDRRRHPDMADCAFIRAAYDMRPDPARVDLHTTRRTLAVVAARLLAAGAWRHAFCLTPPGLLPMAVARAVLKRG